MKRSDRSMRRGRKVRLAIAFATTLTFGSAGAGTATAAFIVTVTPAFPATAAVGETAPASVTITNLSTGAEAAGVTAVAPVTLYPSCGSGVAAPCSIPDPGVYQLNGPFTVTGSPGAVCPTSYTVSAPDPATGAVTFIPVGQTLLDAGESCTFSFTATVLKTPTIDAAAGSAGLQTAHIAMAQTLSPAGINTVSGSQITTVNPAPPPPPPPPCEEGTVTQSNDATLEQGGNTATGGNATATGGHGGAASSGNTATDSGSDTETESGDAEGGDGGNATAVGGDVTAANTATQMLHNSCGGAAGNALSAAGDAPGTGGEASGTARALGATLQTPPALLAPPPAQGGATEIASLGAAAAISGRTGCQARPFKVVVSGRRVARVIFTIDGRVLRTLTRPNSGSRYKALVKPRTLRQGRHRVLARVSFRRQSATATKTLRVVFSRCAGSA